VPATPEQRRAVELVRTLIWWFYADLKAWKQDPCPRRAAALRARFDRIFTRRTDYALLDLGDYPGLIHCPAEGQAVCGELYRVEATLHPKLDAIEGAPTLFRLAPVQIEGTLPTAERFYFRARWDRAHLEVGRREDADKHSGARGVTDKQ